MPELPGFVGWDEVVGRLTILGVPADITRNLTAAQVFGILLTLSEWVAYVSADHLAEEARGRQFLLRGLDLLDGLREVGFGNRGQALPARGELLRLCVRLQPENLAQRG